ncbi:hypothetical protein [Corynebacterium atypicum]|nr:hypothetical protein [Corynebacterium atypicum]
MPFDHDHNLGRPAQPDDSPARRGWGRPPEPAAAGWGGRSAYDERAGQWGTTVATAGAGSAGGAQQSPQWRPGPAPAKRAWWTLAGMLAVLFGFPALIDFAVPTSQAYQDEVVLSADGFDWELPVASPDGGPLTCHATSDSLTGTLYECGDFVIDTFGQERYRDRSRALARSLRFLLTSGDSEDTAASADVAWEGPRGLYLTRDISGSVALGIALIGGQNAKDGGADGAKDSAAAVDDSGEDPEPMLVTGIRGKDAHTLLALGEQVWSAVGGDPAYFRGAFADLAAQQGVRVGEAPGQPAPWPRRDERPGEGFSPGLPRFEPPGVRLDALLDRPRDKQEV